VKKVVEKWKQQKGLQMASKRGWNFADHDEFKVWSRYGSHLNALYTALNIPCLYRTSYILTSPILANSLQIGGKVQVLLSGEDKTLMAP